MKIIIPFRTPTVNHLYWHRGNMKIMTTEAKKVRDKIDKIVKRCDYIHLRNKRLIVNIDICENWLTQDKQIKKKDVANREKFLVDSIFKAMDIDDKYIFEQTFRKVQSVKEIAIVEIEELK